MRQLFFALAVLGVFAAAMPTQADASYFMRGYIVNHDNPFHVDSLYMYHTPPDPIEYFRTFGFGWPANAMDSFDFRASAWPIAIKLMLSQTGTPVQIDSFRPTRGQWHIWHNVATWESCLVMFDSTPRPGIEDGGSGSIPRRSLGEATPNPFSAFTDIRFSNVHEELIELTVYNLVGRPVRTLVAGITPAGTHSAVWDGTDDAGRDLESGIYFCRLSTPEQTLTEKLILDR